MPINLKGVELLKADLRANANEYKQSTFGKITPDQDGDESACGTEQCMAGFCYLREVGKDVYISAIRSNQDMQELCVTPGLRQLGINYEPGWECPIIFDSHCTWPDDLAKAYRHAITDDERVEVACAALDRLNDDGSIKEL